MSGNLQKFRVLMWKNFLLLLKKRFTVMTMIVLPVLATIILVYVRTSVGVTVQTESVTWPPLAPSVLCRRHCLNLFNTKHRKQLVFFAPDTDIVREIMNVTRKEQFFRK